VQSRSEPPRPAAVYDEIVHGERTHVAVYSRLPDFKMNIVEMGPMELVSFRCGSVVTRRYANELTRRARHMSVFILQVSGQSTLRHYGHDISLEPGDFALCNTAEGYELHHAHASDMILFRVPTDILKRVLPTPEFYFGRKLPSVVGMASTAAVMAKDLASSSELISKPALSEKAGRFLLDLLATTYCDALDQDRSGSAVMVERFSRVKLFIEDNLRDPDLSPAMAARHLKLSSRYMRMIFTAGGESPAAYILRRRLEECARQFCSPKWARQSITEIAFSWGFNSGPHFARSFRSRFGESPREYRQRHMIEELNPPA
jgi:AraC-like DNA-binding protein